MGFPSLNIRCKQIKDSLHPTTQSDPDSQTDRPQNRNNVAGCYAASLLRRSIGFAVWTAGARSDRSAHHFSDDLEKMIESPEK